MKLRTIRVDGELRVWGTYEALRQITMKRETKELHGWRFTSVSAIAREIDELLRTTPLKLRVLVRREQLEPLMAECENFKAMGRLEILVP